MSQSLPINGSQLPAEPNTLSSSTLHAKKLGFALLIIMGVSLVILGALGSAGLGVHQGWWALPSLNALSQSSALVLLGGGLGLGIPLLVAGIVLSVKEAQKQNTLNNLLVVGKKFWEDHLGDIGEEPSFPNNLEEILTEPCPFSSGKKVGQTHLLLLVPKTLNGVELTKERLEDLVKNPLSGHATQVTCNSKVNTLLNGKSIHESRWVLIHKEIVCGTHEMGLSAVGYRMPEPMEAMTAYLLQFVRTGIQHPQEKYTLCKAGTTKIAVGDFTSNGLHVTANPIDDGATYGIAPVRIF